MREVLLTNHHSANTILSYKSKRKNPCKVVHFLHPCAIFASSNVIICTYTSVFCFFSLHVLVFPLLLDHSSPVVHNCCVRAVVRRQCCCWGLLYYVQSFLGVTVQLYQSQLSALYCLSMCLHYWGKVKWWTTWLPLRLLSLQYIGKEVTIAILAFYNFLILCWTIF